MSLMRQRECVAYAHPCLLIFARAFHEVREPNLYCVCTSIHPTHVRWREVWLSSSLAHLCLKYCLQMTVARSPMDVRTSINNSFSSSSSPSFSSSPFPVLFFSIIFIFPSFIQRIRGVCCLAFHLYLFRSSSCVPYDQRNSHKVNAASIRPCTRPGACYL